MITFYFQVPKGQVSQLIQAQMGMNAFAEPTASRSYHVVPSQPLIELFLAQESDVHRRTWGGYMELAFTWRQFGRGYLSLSKPKGSHFGVGQFTPFLEPSFSGDWDVLAI